ncbi:hypothetical protein MGLY_33900 [Neomoorella glycerini]|uniref:Natural resistance-associated macrophage protein n=1 Tax=Neomoorella glycerini TaxID=55779 RepID=A0A6I5ZWE6_9FIRM|nr:Nramp family divalent metal transporter [Moorella glycerini]QGP93965.1 hypothetical protein MGLY_33900 [Moorella glycerini]
MSEPRYSIPEAPKGWELVRMLGPGIVWAGMAIGGGELTLNPRVGAIFGIVTLWMPLLAIFLKWFMTVEIGRWSIYTGTSIREGFELLPGPRKWLNWLILFIGLYLGAVHIGGLVAMIGIVTSNLLPFLPPYLWSILIMVSFVALSWSGKYSVLEKAMMVSVALLTLTTFVVFIKIWPGLDFILQGFTFKIPTVTPEWAVTGFKISRNPLVEILPAMAFAGAGAINSLWYSDWILAKGFGVSAKYQLGSSNKAILGELKNVTSEEVNKLKGWFRVMLHDSWWGANLVTMLVTAIFIVNAVVILNPLKQAPAGVGFILTLSKTFTETLGPWARELYLVGAFAVLYSTMATLYDGYARLIDNSIGIVLPDWKLYNRINPLWRYRIWFLYGTLCNFFLVYLFNAVPVQFLQAASWVEGTFMLPVVAFAIAYLTYKVLPGLYSKEHAIKVKPNWIFTAGTILAGCFYAGLIIYSFFL